MGILTGMSQTKSPETEIGCRVGNTSEAVLNCVDGLVHECITKVELKEKQMKN